MNAPPRKLLNAAKMINASAPGMPRTRVSVPRTSTLFRPSEACADSRSGTDTRLRWTTEAGKTTRASTSTTSIPLAPTSSPLITEVTRKLMPDAVPTSPLARSRRLSGISTVTIVDMAIMRIFPAITPAINNTTKTHSTMLVGSRNRSSGVSRYSARGRRVEHHRHQRRRLHHRLLAVMVDQTAEPDPGQGRGYQEQPGDHAGGEDRSGLQEDIERDGEPDREVDDRNEQRVGQKREERLHVWGVQPQAAGSSCVRCCRLRLLGHRVFCTRPF